MSDNRNMILAIVISVLILLGFNYWTTSQLPPESQAPAQTSVQPGQPGQPASPAGAPTAGVAVPQPATAAQATAAPTKADILAATPRATLRGKRANGSIPLQGGKIDDITLPDYRETIDPSSREIVIFRPQGLPTAYFAEFGWVATGQVAVPGGDTLWTADRQLLENGTPLTLTWDNGTGLKFTRTVAVDDNYMFTITDRVENAGGEAVTLFPYGLISRSQTPETTGYYILHEGLLGVFNGTLDEVDYTDLQEKAKIEKSSTGGWIGITDKYWLGALIPDQKIPYKGRFTHHRENGQDKYQADFLGEAVTVAPGASASSTARLFAGAKEVTLLDAYQENPGIARFDLAIDFGWFYWLTKPIFYVLNYLRDHVGNYGIAILLLTVIIKTLFFPLANKSYRAMSKMKKLQPEMLKLRERFGDDKQRMNQEMMALYKREKANPASGCLPMVIQIPVFFALYKVLFVAIEMRHAPFYGWIHDLSAPDPTTIFNLFGLIPWDPTPILPAMLHIGVWPLIMGVTMFLQQKLNPQPADPMQAKIFMFLPIIFTFMLAGFPAGLVIYWAWNNLLSIIQQWVIMKRAGAT